MAQRREHTGAGGMKRLKMKDLERATGVGRESIRFYIREGLLPQPERPGRNVAYYDESFVERIRFIKELQSKRYLPLNVIKAIVSADASPSPGEVEALLALDGKLFPSVDGTPGAPRERLSALAQRTGLPAREIRELSDGGVVEIVTADGEQWLEGSAVRIVELWGRMRAAGFTRELGFETEQCRLYVDMVHWLAREELRLFTRGIAGRVPAEQAAGMAEQGIDLINQMLGLLRRETLLRYVAQGNVPEEAEARPGSRSGTDAS
jgi:DNA-binding transcriptional MerR regulator